MKILKNLLCLAFAALVMTALCACDPADSVPSDPTQEMTQPTTTSPTLPEQWEDPVTEPTTEPTENNGGNGEWNGSGNPPESNHVHHEVEPGTNPGFLYQQNTMRDAMVAACHLNVFNQHSKRVVMANLAQIVNVLQSVILTEGEKMVKTPTWHVFNMYRHHQGAKLLQSALSDEEMTGIGEWKVPRVSESVSERDGIITITLNNLSLSEDKELAVSFSENKTRKVEKALVLKGSDVHDMNTFEAPDTVKAESFTGYREDGKGLIVTIPKASVVTIRVK